MPASQAPVQRRPVDTVWRETSRSLTAASAAPVIPSGLPMASPRITARDTPSRRSVQTDTQHSRTQRAASQRMLTTREGACSSRSSGAVTPSLARSSPTIASCWRLLVNTSPSPVSVRSKSSSKPRALAENCAALMRVLVGIVIGALCHKTPPLLRRAGRASCHLATAARSRDSRGPPTYRSRRPFGSLLSPTL